MHAIADLYNTHPLIVGLMLYWIFSAAISALPSPQNGNAFYLWFYSFSHILAGSIGRAVAAKYPDFFKQAPETK